MEHKNTRKQMTKKQVKKPIPSQRDGDLDQSPEFQKFQGAMAKILTVSKEELKRRDEQWKSARQKTTRKRS